MTIDLEGVANGRLHAAARDARDDAVPVALGAAGLLVVLALVSRHARWELLGLEFWWYWLVLAMPYFALAGTVLVGLSRNVRHDPRRVLVVTQITFIMGFTVIGVAILIAALVSHSG